MKYEKGITVAELIEQLKKLPQDMFVYREEVSDSGWRDNSLFYRHFFTPTGIRYLLSIYKHILR